MTINDYKIFGIVDDQELFNKTLHHVNKAINDAKDAQRRAEASKKVTVADDLSDLLQKFEDCHVGYNLLVNKSPSPVVRLRPTPLLGGQAHRQDQLQAAVEAQSLAVHLHPAPCSREDTLRYGQGLEGWQGRPH